MKVVYYQPGKGGQIEKVALSVDEATEDQMRLGEQKGYPYISREEALEDYLANHWAWLEEDAPNL